MSELGMDSPILPFSGTISDYKFPTFSERIVRRALDDESREKFKTALRKLKGRLPVNHADYDSFRRLQQAVASPTPEAHFGFTFASFHRVYLHQYEKMLQKVAGDTTISLPYLDSALDSDDLAFVPDYFGQQFSDMVSRMGSLSSDVDRRWAVWQTLGGKRAGITDPEWLQTSFVFYDENNNLVRIKVGDCLDIEKFGYTYEDMPNPRSKKFEPLTGKNLSSSGSSVTILPATLDESVKFYATKKKETEDKEAVLMNLYVECDETKNIRFDAYLNENKDANSLEVEMAEYAGSFINFAWPHQQGSEQTKTKTTTWSLEITQVLQDLALAGNNKIPVTLVPKCGGDSVTVKSVDITAG